MWGRGADCTAPGTEVFWIKTLFEVLAGWWCTGQLFEQLCRATFLSNFALGTFPLRMGNTFIRSFVGPVSHLVAHWWQYYPKLPHVSSASGDKAEPYLPSVGAGAASFSFWPLVVWFKPLPHIGWGALWPRLTAACIRWCLFRFPKELHANVQWLHL